MSDYMLDLVNANMWQKWADIFQFGSIGGLFATILILNNMSKHDARIAVWYFAAALLVTGTIGFITSRKALKYRIKYYNDQTKRLGL